MNFGAALLCTVSFCSLGVVPVLANPEKTGKVIPLGEWKNLLERDDFSQWKQWKPGTIVETNAWKIKDGVLHLGNPRKKGGGDQSLVTVKHYQNFELKFDFKLSEKCNSGVKYRSLNNLGFEFQILDDVGASDRSNPKNRVGSIYQLVAAPDTKKLEPIGEWNRGRIVASGNQIEHWLNGEKVASLEYGSANWEKIFKASKYKKYPDFGKQGGEILLQDHGHEVWYKNLLIRELEK